MSGTKWAEPIEIEAKRRFEKFYKLPTAPKKWADDLSKKLLKSHSQEAVTSMYEEFLGGLF